MRVSQTGDWLSWINYFLDGVKGQATDATVRAEKLLDCRAAYRKVCQQAGSSALLLSLVDYLFCYPALTIRKAEELLGVTYKTAQYNVEKLVEASILTEITGRKRNMVFAATRILQIIEQDDPEGTESVGTDVLSQVGSDA